MTSPLKGFENCVLLFQALTTATEVDAFGNAVPLMRSIPVSAAMKLTTNVDLDMKFLQHNQRQEDDAIAISGYCVSPTQLPLEVREETTARLTFNGRPGRFLLSFINAPYGREGIGLILEQSVGTKLLGWFMPDR